MSGVSCPYCRALCYAEFVYVGVGFEQVTPYTCDECHARQIGPYDEPSVLTALERRTGWYQPFFKPEGWVDQEAS